MSKRTLLMAVSLVAALALATTGTLAYLSDSDADVNVMTLGKVEIKQIEQERRADGTLGAFTDNNPLLPAVFEGSSIPFASADKWVKPDDAAWKVVEDNVNVVDKFVTVQNTGKTDAYVRTIVAVEAGCIANDTLIHTVQNDVNATDPTVASAFAAYNTLEQVTIHGTTYDVLVFTYKDALAPGETTIPSLKQVYMNKNADNAFVETLGEDFDILVLSQAVQAQGFEGAEAALNAGFGEIDKTNVIAWLEKITVPTLADFMADLAKGKAILRNDIDAGTEALNVPVGESTIDLNNNTLTGALSLSEGSKLTLQTGTIDNKNSAINGIYVPKGAFAELTGVNFNSARHVLRAEGGDMIIHSGEYKSVPISKSTLHALYVMDGSTVTVYGGTFTGPAGTMADSGNAVKVKADSTVIIYGGHFSGGKTATLSVDNGATLTIYGGTFDQDPSAWVAPGYKAVQSNGLYTVVKE